MTAAERAARVLAEVRFAWQRGRIADTVSRSEQAAQVAALMADPVIADLAIEAGWLEHARNYKYSQEGAYICGTFAGWVDDETDGDGRVADGFYAPLYRRREANDA